MTIDFRSIYRERAQAYHRLVEAEDVDGELVKALAAIAPLEGARVLEVGAGTGRVAKALLDAGATYVLATEPADAMRQVAAANLDAYDATRWDLLDASLPALELPANATDTPFDIAVAGWVIGHFRGWSPDNWREMVDASIAAMAERLRPGGALIVIETLTTGATEPSPPTPELAEYYERLEKVHGMRHAAIRTDYGFASPTEAARVMSFFFGDALTEAIKAHRWRRVPECTGVWHTYAEPGE